MLALLLVSGVIVPLASADSCSNYTLVNDTGLVDSNHLLRQANAADVAECCTECAATPNCGAFTFNKNLATMQCRMTATTNILPHPVQGVVSGKGPSVTPPSPPPAPNYCTGKKCRNVLYFVSDDMRADWRTYGLPVKTPNLDALAAKSVLFEHAYCQISVCAPSRMSFMTGRRPDTFGVWNFIDTVPLNTSATPGHFKDHGYITLGLGKTFHQGNGAWNADAYWSLDEKPYFQYEDGGCPHGSEGGGHCVKTDDEIYDYKLRVTTIEYLQYATNRSNATGRPFYVMTGFRKPHAPWEYPQRMWDLYTDSAIAVAEHKTLPTGTPLIAWSRQLDVKLENGTQFPYDPENPVPDWVMQDQRHAYYACVSYVDEHVGYILDTLQQTGMADNTLVLFHADHGYHLGEHGEWEKKSNFDLVVRVPLLIHAPWMPATWGTRSAALFDLVNVFPTVAALAGLPHPEGVDGEDLSTLLNSPNSSTAPAAAFHQYPACGCGYAPAVCYNQTRESCNGAPRTKFNSMGYSMRTSEWRLTSWLPWNQTTLTADWDGPRADELYTHVGDGSYEMDNFENVNEAAANPLVVATLFGQMRGFFQAHADRTAAQRDATAMSAQAAADTSDPSDV